MDRIENKANAASPWANQGAVDSDAAPVLETPEGRNDDKGLSDRGTAMDADARNVAVGAQPRSAVTAFHDPGTGAQENEDGFDEIEEGIRAAAEDTPTGDGAEDAASELPAFERGMTAPKV